MANSIKFEVRGLRELEQNLRRLEENVQKRVVRNAVKVAMEPALEEAKLRAPVHTPVPKHRKYGHLRDNLNISTRVKIRDEARSILGTGDAFWARFLEFGTVKMRPHPFLRQAFESQTRNILDALVRELRAGIEKG